MKKRIFCVLLSLVLTLTMMPIQTSNAAVKSKTKVRVSTQHGIKKALKNKKLKTLTVKTKKSKSFTVAKGTHKKVHVIFDAPKSSLNNKSIFKKITIKKGKKLTMGTLSGNILISKGASVKEIKITRDNSKINFTVNGKLEKINVSTNSTIIIKGTTNKNLIVESTNKDAIVTVVNNSKTVVKGIDAVGNVKEILNGDTKDIGGKMPYVPAPVISKTFKAVYISSDASLTFYYDSSNHNADGTNIILYDNLPTNAASNSSWPYHLIDKFNSVTIDDSVKDYTGLRSTAYMFSGIDGHTLGCISGIENLNVSNVTNMASMFENYAECSNTISEAPNVNSWDVSNVKYISSMFLGYGCGSTILDFRLDLGGWDLTGIDITSAENYKDVFEQTAYSGSNWYVKIPSATGAKDNSGDAWYVGDGNSAGAYIIPTNGKTFTVANAGCLAEGTMITMADGSKKAVENLSVGEDVLTFDHETGKISHSEIVDYYIYSDPCPDAMTLHFSDNKDVTVVTGHAFYDKELKKYNVITKYNVQKYINHKFFCMDDMSWKKLEGYTLLDDEKSPYVVVTKNHLNCVANGMLSNEDDLYCTLANVFEHDNNMKVLPEKKASEIQKYGLWTYDDLNYLTHEVFDGLNLKYFGILVGRGVFTRETIDIICMNAAAFDPGIMAH